MKASNHTFIVCAYKESPYLETCIRSLLQQTVATNVIVSTSTPNSYIESLAKKYDLPYFVNTGKSGICEDWNFGISQVSTKYFTLAHQDDVYKEEYVENMLDAFEKAKQPLLFFSDYAELRSGKEISNNTLLKIKKILLFPFRFSKSSIWIRRRILSLGNPICCPAVSFCKENLPPVIFDNRFKCDLDWDCWERMSKRTGQFCYVNKILMCHRIHEESTTTELIENNVRVQEDYEMYRRFWPKFMADILISQYKKSLHSNEL
ncbi:MAG: glycosyltransferase family 2 protein [Bacillota bacterium]|nr:glycosyltransferase family 2 protein [Bacillota bacterium]